MKILSIHVVAFGKLSNVNLQLREGVNAIQNTNGFGKTTMASFIRAMLYGFTYKTVGGVKDSARFAPWQGTGRFGGSMTVEHEGEVYRIERFFGSTARQETLTVTNDRTGKPLELQMQPGEFFLGLTADSYDRSAYFPQEAVELSSNDNFDARLGNLIQNGAEDYDKIQDKLRNYKKALRYERGNGGKIYELDVARSQILQRQNEAEKAERRAREIDQSLAEIEKKKQALLNSQKTQTISKPTPQPRQKSNRLLLCVGVALALLGIAFVALGLAKILGVVAYAVGAPCLVLGVGVAMWCAMKHRANSKRTEQPIVATTNYESDTVQELNALSVRFGQLTAERNSQVYDKVAIADELGKIERARQEAEFEYTVADTVSQLLAEAKDNLSSSYLPKLAARCSELLSTVTDSTYSVVVDRSFNVKIREQGQTHDMSEFSRGIREITLLCFRIALSELLYDEQIPFIIIDDAFVNFDEHNFIRATKLLKGLSKHAQVVYFTCHNRTGELLN